MKVFKFGGTSVSSVASLLNVKNIVSSTKLNGDPLIIIVPALKGIADDLNPLIDLIPVKDKFISEFFSRFKKHHQEFIAKLFNEIEQIELKSILGPLEKELHRELMRLSKQNVISSSDRDNILAFGKIFSAKIMSFFLKKNGHFIEFLDPRRLIITDNNYGNANLIRSETVKRMRNFFRGNSKSYVVPGNLGSTTEGKTTTLGRMGSDYTSTIFGTILKAKSVTKWTDADGVLTADPNLINSADSVHEITLNELQSISFLGPKVIVHPDAITELSDNNVPLIIKNTFNLKFQGTMVSNKSIQHKSIFSLNNSCVIVDISRDHLLPKDFFKRIRDNGHLFFRIKELQGVDLEKLYFVVSNKCLKFIKKEIEDTQKEFRTIDQPQKFEVTYSSVSLISITKQEMDKEVEISKAISLLEEKGITPIGHRLFNTTFCLLLSSSDSANAIGYLYDGLVHSERIPVLQNI